VLQRRARKRDAAVEGGDRDVGDNRAIESGLLCA